MSNILASDEYKQLSTFAPFLLVLLPLSLAVGISLLAPLSSALYSASYLLDFEYTSPGEDDSQNSYVD